MVQAAVQTSTRTTAMPRFSMGVHCSSCESPVAFAELQNCGIAELKNPVAAG
jgi:hypothetical protein